MSRKPSEIRELAKRVEALEKHVKALDIPPRERLRRAVERLRQKTKHIPARELDKAIDAALGEIRRERPAS